MTPSKIDRKIGRPAFANNELFVQTWQDSDSVKEVSIRCRVKEQSCFVRAMRLRKGGVPLKSFNRPKEPPLSQEDRIKINTLAKKTLMEYYRRKANEIESDIEMDADRVFSNI